MATHAIDYFDSIYPFYGMLGKEGLGVGGTQGCGRKNDQHDNSPWDHGIASHNPMLQIVKMAIAVTVTALLGTFKTLVQRAHCLNPIFQPATGRALHLFHMYMAFLDSTNATSLECIESSMLVVCLDQAWPKSFNRLDDVKDGRDDVSKALQMIHGGGATLSSANRWFDKTLQIVIGVDGVCGLCYEHSPAEGIVVIQLMEDILKCWDKEKANDSYTKDDKENGGLAINVARRLHWNICNDVMNAISAAAGNLYKMVEELDFYVLRFEEFGRDFAKIQKMSPDVLVQIALQLTYYKVHRRLVATYESASTRRFRLGRVDNIRASTPEVLSWVRAMVGETDVDNEEKVRLFRAAANIQTEIMTYNILGQGIDCHLLGLRELAKDLQYPTPQIFKDETYLISNRFMLSTSQVTTSTDSFMGYGPVVPDGYGASYNLQPSNMLFCISSFKSFEDTDSEMFAMSLEGSLLQIRELLERNQDMCKTR